MKEIKGRRICTCECGGTVRGVRGFGRWWTWCEDCTPVVVAKVDTTTRVTSGTPRGDMTNVNDTNALADEIAATSVRLIGATDRFLTDAEQAMVLAALRAYRASTVVLGFASYKGGSFELIVRDDKSGTETTLEGTLRPGQLEIVDRILPTCVYVKADTDQPTNAMASEEGTQHDPVPVDSGNTPGQLRADICASDRTAVWSQAVEACAKVAENYVPGPAGHPYEHVKHDICVGIARKLRSLYLSPERVREVYPDPQKPSHAEQTAGGSNLQSTSEPTNAMAPGFYGCRLPPGGCGCPQDVRHKCRHAHWVTSGTPRGENAT
jgi:hypothetical protein